MIGFRYLEGVVTLLLDKEKCIGCRMCVRVCPHAVFEMDGTKARLVDRDACMECGACALNCPSGAIAVDAGVGCAAGLVTEWLRERGWTKAPGAPCCD